MLRFLLFLAISAIAFGGSLDEAAKALAKKVLTRLAPDEVANITWRDAAPAEVKSAFAAALRRRPRNPKSVEIRATLSEDIRGPLLIAEIVREGGNVVEIVNSAPERTEGTKLPVKFAL